MKVKLIFAGVFATAAMIALFSGMVIMWLIVMWLNFEWIAPELPSWRAVRGTLACRSGLFALFLFVTWD